jgi:hypothetical protein
MCTVTFPKTFVRLSQYNKGYIVDQAALQSRYTLGDWLRRGGHAIFTVHRQSINLLLGSEPAANNGTRPNQSESIEMVEAFQHFIAHERDRLNAEGEAVQGTSRNLKPSSPGLIPN